MSREGLIDDDNDEDGFSQGNEPIGGEGKVEVSHGLMAQK